MKYYKYNIIEELENITNESSIRENLIIYLIYIAV